MQVPIICDFLRVRGATSISNMLLTGENCSDIEASCCHYERLIKERQANWRKKESEFKEEIDVCCSNLYLACFSFYLRQYKVAI